MAAGCIFGCRPGAEDAIEHYAHCRVVTDLAERNLGLPREATPQARLAAFLLLDTRGQDNLRDETVAGALRTAAVYRVHGLVRHGRVHPGANAQDAWKQSLRELARGSRAAAAVLDRARAYM